MTIIKIPQKLIYLIVSLVLLMFSTMACKVQAKTNLDPSSINVTFSLIEKAKGWKLFASKSCTAMFHGKFSEDSVDAIIAIVKDVGAKNSTLMLASSGGKHLPAIKLGKFIHDNKIELHATACPFVSAYYIFPASPNVYFGKDTLVTMGQVSSARHLTISKRRSKS